MTPEIISPPSSTLLTNAIILTEEQQLAISKIVSWFVQKTTPQEFKLGGYAGTGKTTIIKYFLGEGLPLGEHKSSICAIVCAFTGKACYVLRKKGIHSAATIHSTIYDVEDLGHGKVEFHLKTRLESKPNLIIVDEASMISTELYHDLKSFNIKILFIGDPGQLEPVGDNPNLMAKPDYVLSKIHRQAEKSPIITLATNVRNGLSVKSSNSTLQEGVSIKPKFITDEELSSCDQILCGKNATRALLNRRVRMFLGNTEPFVIGEKIICLRNNRKYGLFNGLICNIESFEERSDVIIATLRDEAIREYKDIPIWKTPFLRDLEPNEQPPYDTCLFDYGYAITVHKSQGSEWPHVLVYDEVMVKTDMKRWRYTAITRASEKLTYCI